ncbi:MAG: regulatory iron-sulfur-containing complex subunit RicT [Dehalococcoidia bacterium]
MREPLHDVAGVRFRNAGKIFYFDTAGMRLEAGEYVVVETSRGPEIGRVVIAPGEVVVNELNRDELKPILRLATEADIRRMDALRQRAREALLEARAVATDAGFPAHLDSAEFTLDGRRLTLTFASDERLDYRDMVRRTSDRLGVKVDMRQVGDRDRARNAGGYGICGRELCCANWLATFPSISIRMAKEQDLPLNPQKISGLCGRLLCCLSYEEEGYKEMRKTLPKPGQRCSTPTGEGKVIGLNILKRSVTLLVEGQRIEVGDRDLGTVVRWDPASKAGDPPPSISRADAIAQGLIEADERDLAGPEAEEDSWERREPVGRGRLPGGGPRKEMRSRPAPSTPAPNAAQGAPSEQAPSQPRGRGRGGRPQPAEGAQPPQRGERREPREPRPPRGQAPGDGTPREPREPRPPRGQAPGDGAPREPREPRPPRGQAPGEGTPRTPREPRPPRGQGGGGGNAPAQGEGRRAPRRDRGGSPPPGTPPQGGPTRVFRRSGDAPTPGRPREERTEERNGE